MAIFRSQGYYAIPKPQPLLQAPKPTGGVTKSGHKVGR